MKAQCPNCQTRFKAPDSYAGKTVKCLKCKNSFTIELPKPEPEKISLPVPLNTLPVPPIKQRGNFFIKLWNNSPVAFRTAFLATLGVLSALLFAYYVIRVPKFVSEKTTSITTQTSSIQTAHPQNLQKLAAIIILNAYVWKYDELYWFEVKAMDQFIATANPSFMVAFSKTMELQLATLYTKIYNLKLPQEEKIQLCHKYLLDAVETDCKLQKKVQSFMTYSDSLSGAESGKISANKHNKALESCWLLLDEIDPELILVTNSIINYDSK